MGLTLNHAKQCVHTTSVNSFFLASRVLWDSGIARKVPKVTQSYPVLKPNQKNKPPNTFSTELQMSISRTQAPAEA